ncbi:hypothetical protein HN51_020472 [Arachis hypogaea]|uniref:Uncharacterized protein n=1 Tax=Arachis hypogaea TaxID=3818 RepID=A0A445C135_ARAHY|nr:uncharacterized protein DS421_8g249760 [Arachis hypogaea]RYR44624.1 hypothetical protein Ahy_A08g040927 [Arachis hypogaea]
MSFCLLLSLPFLTYFPTLSSSFSPIFSLSQHNRKSATMDDDPYNHNHRLLTLLNTLKQASIHLHTTTNPLSFFLFKPDQSNAAIEALLELEPKAQALFSTDPSLRTISHTLSNLKTLIKNHGGDGGTFLRRQIAAFKISKLARSLESEIQAYVDRVTVINLVKTLLREDAKEDEKINTLIFFEERLSQGFDLGFQDLVLRAKIFQILEQTLLLEPSKRVREQSAFAIEALVKFNKNVFVGLVLMGPTVKSLLDIASSSSIRVVTSLVRFIRSPLVDEILCGGEIKRIIGFLRKTTPWCEDDVAVCTAALECVLEIAYIGRREVVETMLEEGLVKLLMELQRKSDDVASFEGCVWRFSVQVEVGEGLSFEEKREVKMEILRLVKEASVSDAEAASVSAEILWGSSP